MSLSSAVEGKKIISAASTRAAAGQAPETLISTGTTGMMLASSGAPSLLSPGRQSMDDADAGDELDISFELDHQHHDMEKGNVVLSNLPSQSEFLRELADLASSDIRRLLRYTVKNTICLIEGYKDDSEERATRNCEEALSCFFEKLDDYVEFAVRRVEQVCKSGASYGVGGVQSTLTTAILQRQLRRSIDHARELSNNLENAEQKEHDLERKFREMRKMYYSEVLNLRQRCTRLQRQVLNDLPVEADIESVQVDDDVSFWGEKTLVEPWVQDMLDQQASEMKARASIAEQKLMMQIERQKDQMDSYKSELSRYESTVASLKAKVQFARMRLAMGAVANSKRNSAEDILNLDDIDHDDVPDTKTQGEWNNTAQSQGGKSPPKVNPAVARRKRAENLITEDPAEQFQRVQVLQSAVDEGALKLQSLKQLSSQWEQKLKDLDDEAWKETSSTVLSQIQSRIAKMHDEFVPLQSNSETGELAKVDDKDSKDPWMLAADAESRATKSENEVTLLTLDKQNLQKLLQAEKEEPQKQRKQLRAMNIQMEAKDATIAQNDKVIEAANKEKEAMQGRIDAMQARLEQLEEQLLSERHKKPSEDENPFSHFLEDEMSLEAASRKHESQLDADDPDAAGADPDAADEDGNSESFGEYSEHEGEVATDADGRAQDSQQPGKPKSKRQVRRFVAKTKSGDLENALLGDDDMQMEHPEGRSLQPKKALSMEEVLEDNEIAEEQAQPEGSRSPSRGPPSKGPPSRSASPRPASRLESDPPQENPILARRNTSTGTRLRVAVNKGRRRSSGDAEMLKSHLESHEDESLDLLKTPRASEANAVFTKQVSGSETISESEGTLGWSATPSGSAGRQQGVPKLVHQRLVKIAVERERLRWQTLMPRSRSAGALGDVLKGQRRKTIAEGVKEAKTVESVLSAAEEEADFQRHASLFETGSGRLADRFRSNEKSAIQLLDENNRGYLKVMALLQKARKAMKDVTEQYSAALFTADANALEVKELQRLFNASEVRGRTGWELQRQCLMKCQKALKRTNSDLKIDPALIARTPGEALEQLSTDVSGALVNQVQRSLRNTRTKADRVVHQRLEQVTQLAVDDALALVPVQTRLVHDAIDQAFTQTCKDGPDSDQPKTSPSAREIKAQKMAEAEKLMEGSEIDLGDLTGTSLPLAGAVSGIETPTAQNKSSSLRTDLAQMRSQARNKFLGYQKRAHDLECDTTAMRVLGQLRERLAMEAETTASDGGDSCDDEMSSDDEVFSRARHAIWIEVQDDDFELGDRSIFPESNSNQERHIENLRPLAPASEDTLTRCEMPSMQLPVAMWTALPEHLEVGEVEQVSRGRREAVERQTEHRFERMVNQQAEKERRQHEKAERASSKEESGGPPNLSLLDWTPPRSPVGNERKSTLWSKAMNVVGKRVDGKETDPEAEADREQKVQTLTQSMDSESLELMQLLADGLNEQTAENAGSNASLPAVGHLGSSNFQHLPQGGDNEDSSIQPERSVSAMSNQSMTQSPRSNLLHAVGPPQKLRRPLSARPLGRPNSARANHERTALKRTGSLDFSHQVDTSDTKEDEGPKKSDAVPHKPATIMEKLITVVLKAFKNQSGNNRMQEMMQEMSPERKTSMLSGFVETFVEDRQQQIAKMDGDTESDPATTAQLKAWGVSAPKPIMVDKSFQCTREDRVTLKEHGTQTEAVLSERDESTRRINVREQALKALADRLANLADPQAAPLLGMLNEGLASPGHYHHDALVGPTHGMPIAPGGMSRSASEGDIFATARKSTMPKSLHPDLSGFLPLSLGDDQSPRLLSAEHSPRFGAQDLARGGNPRGNVDRDDVARMAAKALLVPGAESLRAQAAGLPGDFLLQGVSLGRGPARGKQLVTRGLGGAQSAYSSRRSTVCAPSAGALDLEEMMSQRKKSDTGGSRIASRKNTEFEFSSGTSGVTSFARGSGSGDAPGGSPRQLVTRSATQGGILLTPAAGSLQASRRNSFHALGLATTSQSGSRRASFRETRRESRRASGIGLLSQLPEVSGSAFPEVVAASARRMTQKAAKTARSGGSEDAAATSSVGEIQVFTGNEASETVKKETDQEHEEEHDSDSSQDDSSEDTSHSHDASDPGEKSDGDDTPKTLGGGDLLLDGLLDNLVTEVVDFAQSTDLQWDSIPGRVVTWLKYNLMQRQQGVLYNSSWTTSELDDFPGMPLLDREQIVKDFEFFLFHAMSLERPVRATDQRRALKKIYRQACVGDAIDRPAEPEKAAAKMPHVESKTPAPAAAPAPATMGPPMVIMSMKSMASTTSMMTDASTECIDPSLLKWSSAGTLSSGSVTQSQQLYRSRPRLGKTASKPSVASSEYASTLSIDSRGPQVTPAEGDSSANDSDVSRDASDTEDGSSKRFQEDAKIRPISDILERPRPAPPPGLSRQQLAEHHLGTLLGFDISATRILDVQQDMYCQHYFRNQEGLARGIGLEPFPGPEEALTETSQSQFPAAASSWPGTADPQQQVRHVDVGLVSGPLPFDSQVLVGGQERASTAGPAVTGHSYPIAVAVEQRLRPNTAPETGTAQAQAFQRAQHVRLLAQRLEALRPYHLGPIPPNVVEQLRQLDRADASVSRNFGGLAGTTIDERRRLLECLDPLYQRIKMAVNQSYGPQLRQGAREDAGGRTPRSAEGEQLSQRLAGDTRNPDRINSTLEGLCKSAESREYARKALLRFAFRRLRNFSQPSQASDDKQVDQGFTLRVMAQEDTVGKGSSSNFLDSGRPPGATTAARKPPLDAAVQGPPEKDFVGAVSWSYKGEASLAATSPGPRSSTTPGGGPGRGSAQSSLTPRAGSTSASSGTTGTAGTVLPRLSKEWQFRPGTAPEVTTGNREPLPEPPPGYEQGLVAARPDTAPEAAMPGVHGLSPSSRQGTVGGSGHLVGNPVVAAPASGRPSWKRGVPGRQPQNPRDQVSAGPDRASGGSNVSRPLPGVASRQQASDHPAAATPTTKSVFAQALGRTPTRGKPGAPDAPGPTPRTGNARRLASNRDFL